ncbi:hypothetical protein [Xanthomonas graminis]|uniref:Uncharacterized protein n=1 Tax=Xanthomonas graminis pv. arrhenatheri LMG 727 TaxID=1195923 RepID=A0A0K3A5X9_9XANT|nr:hypothetical protein [Xanthomonas translucens]UKE78667.1 hypothetical protein KM317_05400 [Xanthomonas translucens pv. arrhenatheri]CTP92682.1 hypothetical protein XTALMG727_3851 [Xanthomonas translucens pv. arrhenatheri LMG 727]
MTQREIPAIQQMLKESKDALSYSQEIDNPVNANNLCKAVSMWRSREIIFVKAPYFRNTYPKLDLHLPEQTQTDAHADPQEARD